MNDKTFDKKVMEVCDQALSYGHEERQAFLASVCAGDTQLLEAVETLVKAVSDSSGFLHEPAKESEFEPGGLVGGYKILRKLDRGGMGSVYMAERKVSGHTQRVALKVMRTFLHSSDMIERFDEERKILARLHHPYIASLIDGGTTEKGLPFLVMELIEGVPIDTHCDTNRLTVVERLKLIQKVALALQSAHQNLVVHSDLKPNNILITADGIPKLLDFGIAKLIRPNTLSEDTTPGSSEIQVLTPDYASPEQIAGDIVTTTSDVYSLGVLTYKLLVGETPYARDSSTDKNQKPERVVSTHPLASEHILSLRDQSKQGRVAACRNVSIARLSRQFSGDIDAILSKSLKHDPAQRYPSAMAFANDLNHFSKGMPVDARGSSAWYRFSKFVGRHRLSVVASAAAIVALVSGLGVSLWQAHIAQKRFDDLHGFAETVIFDLQDEIQNLPGATSARQLMTRESLHYLDNLAKDAGNDRALQLDLSKAYKRLGDVLGNPNNANLGDDIGALESYQKALVIAEQLSDSINDDAEIERHKAIVHEKMAAMFAWQNNMPEALKRAEKSLGIFESLVGTYPDEHLAKMSVAISHLKFGDLLGHPHLPSAGRQSESLKHYELTLAGLTPLATEPSSTNRARRYYALVHERIGTMLSELKRFDEALTYFEASLNIRQGLAQSQGSNANTRRDVGIAFEKIGDLELARGNPIVSIPLYVKALAVYRELANADSENSNAVRTLAIGLENLGEAHLAAGHDFEAREVYEESLQWRRVLVKQSPDNERLLDELTKIEQLVQTFQDESILANP